MSPHQTAEEIIKPYGFGETEGAEIIGKITVAIQAASNEELSRRRERVAALEAELVEAKRMLLGAAPTIAEHCIAYGDQMLEDAMIEFATKPGSTAALDAAIAEATEKVAEERDAALCILNCLARYEAVEREEEDGKLCGLAYDGSIWGPCYDPSYEPYELVEKIAEWLKAKVGTEALEKQTQFLAERDARIRAEGRKAGLEEAADVLEFVASGTFYACDDEWSTAEPDEDDERNWVNISGRARAVIANAELDQLAAQAGEVKDDAN